MLTSSFARTETWKASAKLVSGLDWMTVSKDGRAALMTTGPGNSPTPPDYLLMALGACAGNGIKFMLEKQGKPVRDLKVEVEGDWADKPQRRISDIRLHVTTDADVDADSLHKIVEQVEAKMCPVSGTLATPPHITSTAKVNRK